MPTLGDWIDLHRERLAGAFSALYGHQVQEWYDFVEAEYASATGAMTFAGAKTQQVAE